MKESNNGIEGISKPSAIWMHWSLLCAERNSLIIMQSSTLKLRLIEKLDETEIK
jgi:hypothetical protein